MQDVALAVQLKIPMIIWGPPGTGKTSAIYQLGKALNLPTEVVIASIHDPSDFSGLPIPITGDDPHVWYAAPDWAVRLAKAGRGLLFFDEISCASPSTQAALLRPVLEGVVGSLKLPDAVARVAAANPPEQAAGGWNLTPPLANRFCHKTWTVDSERWIEGILSDWPMPSIKTVPDNVEDYISSAKALVASFIRTRPSLLMSFPKDESAQAGAWPSPRSWTMAARFLGACNSIDADEDTMMNLIVGSVGSGAAQEFLTWQKNLDLPQPKDVLNDPKGFPFPDRDDKVFAVISSAMAYAASHMTPTLWEKAWLVIERTVNEKRADIAAVCAKQIAKSAKKGYPLPSQMRSLAPILKTIGEL